MSKQNEKTLFSDQYLVYDRKSTDDPENQKNSLAYQQMRNVEFAKKNSLPIANVTTLGFCKDGIINESHSGFKESEDFEIKPDGSIQYRIDRPKFLRLIGFLKNKEIKGAIFLCWDRASRNGQDDVLIKKLLKLGCDIRFSEATYDKTSSGDLHMDIDGMFASHYSRVISEKVKNAHAKLRAEGRCLYFAPIGYLDQGSDNKPFDLERAPIVKRIFELYATGEWSFAQLGKWSKEQGLTTKPVRRKRTKEEILANIGLETVPKTSRPADHKTIEYILSNPFYIGKVRIENGFMDGKFHQPLIDVALFNKVQAVLRSRKVSVYYVDKDFFTYRGMLRCSCDRLYSPYQQKGINYYRTRCKAGCSNTDKNLKDTDVHKLVQQALSTIYFTDEELKNIEEKAKSDLGSISERRSKELDDLHIQRKKVFADLDYLMDNKLTLLRTNTMKIEDIKIEEGRLTMRLAEIDSRMKIYAETAQEMLRYVITFSELVKNASAYYEFALDSEKREIATQVFSELVFSERKLVKYNAKEGFEALLNRSWVSGSACWSMFEPMFQAQISVLWSFRGRDTRAEVAPSMTTAQTRKDGPY